LEVKKFSQSRSLPAKSRKNVKKVYECSRRVE
jgi:hypothetical protein